MSKRAFSLIELSIVILIIGILIAGITQGSRLVEQFRISSARNLTQSSPVHGITNLISWHESATRESFDAIVDPDSSTANRIANWYDLEVSSTTKNNATQTNTSNQPILLKNQINGLPVVRFDGSSSFLNLPDATVPFGDSSYTIFFVSRLRLASCLCALLSSGTSGTANFTNNFRYGVSNTIHNYWFFNDIISPSNSVMANVPYLLTFFYNNSATNPFRAIRINGAVNTSQSVTTRRQSTTILNRIGLAGSTEYMNGDIAEIIIFDRPLSNDEIIDVERYLSKKWAIKIS